MTYSIADDNSSAAVETPSFLESAWGLAAGTIVAGTKDIVDSIGTIGGAIGVTSPYEASDTRAVIKDYAGENAAQFYDRNPDLVEGAGILASTLVPGTAGIKVLRAAQAAEGSMLGKLLNLPLSTLKKSRAAAKDAMLAGDAVYGGINGNAIKALGAGLASNVLDMAAFETAAMTVTFASPVYSDFTTGDYLKSMATNIAFGGAVGGAFSAAKTGYGTLTARVTAGAQTAPLRNIKGVGAAIQTPWVNLIGWIEALDMDAATIAAKQLGASDTAISVSKAARETAARDGINAESLRLANGDAELAGVFSNMLTGTTAEGAKVDALGIAPLAKHVTRGVEKDAADTRVFDTLTNESYDAGVSPGKHLGDTLTMGHDVFVRGDVVSFSAGKQLTHINTAGDFTKLGEIEAQAAWVKASMTSGYELTVKAGDLPMMEKLLDVTDEVLAKNPAIIGGKLYRTHTGIARAVVEAKAAQVEELAGKMLPEELTTRLNVKPEFLHDASPANSIGRSGEELSKFLRTPRYISVAYDLPKLTKAVDPFFETTKRIGNTVSASISASDFSAATASRVVKDKAVTAINKNLDAGKTIAPPTITVYTDGSMQFDGVQRLNAIKSREEFATADSDHVPVHVTLEKGATLPATLPNGAPFPVILNAEGKMVPNPRANPVPTRLTRAYAEESLRIANMNKLHSDECHMVAAAIFPDTINFPGQELFLSLMDRTNTGDVGAKFLTNTEGVTGGIGGITQQIGQLANKLMKQVHEATDTALNQVLLAPMKDPEFKTAAELIATQNKLRSTPSNYVTYNGQMLREDVAINKVLAAEKAAAQQELDALSQTRKLTNAEVKAFKARIRNASRVIAAPLDGSPEIIPLSEEAFKVVEANTQLNARRLEIGSKVQAVAGNTNVTLAQQHGLQRVYFPPVNTRKFPHFVFVRQADSITKTSHTSVVTASSAEALATKVKLLQREYPGMEFVGGAKTDYQFLYKKDIESFHKAQGDYEYSRGMNDNFIDSALKSKKEMHEPNPPIDAQHAKEFWSELTDWNRRMDDKSVRDVLELKYGQAFKQLEVMGDSYVKAGTSTFSGNTAGAASYAAQSVSNPYGDMLKQALDIGKQLEYPRWLAANEFLNKGWSEATLRVRKGFLALNEAKNPRDLAAEVTRLNEMTDRLGFGNPYEVTMLEKYREMLPANPTLSANISKGNALLNFLVLGSDMLQAFNTLIGTTVHATELAALRGNILRKNEMGAGKLVGLAPEDVPGAVELNYRAAKEFWSGGDKWNYEKGVMEQASGKEIMAMYVKYGLRVGDAQMLADMADNLAYNPALRPEVFGKQLGVDIDKSMEVVRRWTGNTAADAVSRFMAARSMHIMTDIAASKGLISSEQEAAVYINQHVTRVHGATLASQRPIMFSGPVGQSIGVFMTFYTNFLQRMFQHAGAGDKGAVATMAGMQVGLYGLQGLPAFNFVNTHIIGTASGNIGHKDIYGAVGGSEDAKWIMYGAGSNLLGLIHPDLKVNLYSRGDLNPRSATILPTSLEDTALYSATKKTVSNLSMLAQHIAGGAPVGASLLFAMEHNGVNRPISGIGAFLGGGQTTSKGGLLASYGDTDLASFAFLARIAGGKPLDDATAADGLYRMQAYKADKAARVNAVGENMRLALKSGELPDVLGFMQDYTHAGGDTSNFNKFMKRQFSMANNSQINKAASDLGSPEAQGLSRIMGGEMLQDAENP